MVALIIIGSILAYFVIGVISGRYFFINVLGTASRTHSYQSHLHSAKYSSALAWGWNGIWIWPVTWVLWLLQAPTPYERLQNEQKKKLELEQEIKKLEEKYGLTIQ